MEITQTPEPLPKKGLKTSTIVVLIIFGVLVVAAIVFTFYFARAPGDVVTIDPAHQQCSSDTDCTLASTKCSCDCGTAVNKEYQQYYHEQLTKECENYSGFVCSVYCNYEIKCVSGVCTRTEKVSMEHDISSIVLNIKAPFSDETITIKNTGNIMYEGRRHIFINDNTGWLSSKTISSQQYIDLAEFIENSGFFSLNETYKDDLLQDETGYTITVTKDAQQTSVYCYGECPDDAVEIREQILELWGKDILNIGV